MNDPAETITSQPETRKKRTPKACNHCRQSKSRCDERRPACSRCQNLQKECIYAQKTKSVQESKIEALEDEITNLRQQLSIQQTNITSENPARIMNIAQSADAASPQSIGSGNPSSPSYTTANPALKRKRSRFSIRNEAIVPNFIQEGLIVEHQALSYFNAFFQGCNRYVPLFDTEDSFATIKARSGLLFNAICAVGCGVSGDPNTDCRMLHAHLKRWLTSVILSSRVVPLETVQALLIMACWMPERSLILAIATRMAVDLQLDTAFDRLVSFTLTNPRDAQAFALMKSTRTWFLLMNLEQILQVDAGNLLGLRVKGIRRCRALIEQPFSVALDTRLFSQVELNHLRTKIDETLTVPNGDLIGLVEDARVDIDVWYRDWERIMKASALSGNELPSLLANLTIQRYWAEAMVACRAVRATGIQNIEVMSSDLQEMLEIARTALQCHLHTMLNHSHYLSNFRYAMDFVWAKCAFSFLLLIKLTILLADDKRQDLLTLGRSLHERLSEAVAYGSSKIYVRLLELSLEKFGSLGQAQPVELDTFVPEEFTYEWDWHFPLNLFTSPTGWDLLFDQYLIGDDLFMSINNI